jgi:hypothetical protein
MMKRKLIRTKDDIPNHFDSSDEEAEFWETHELSDEFLRAHRLPRGQAYSPVLQEMRDKRAAELAAQGEVVDQAARSEA